MNGEKGIRLGDAWQSGSEPKQGGLDSLTGGSPSVESQIQSRVRGASTGYREAWERVSELK